MQADTYWQGFVPPEAAPPPPWGQSYPAFIDDRRRLLLPIRPLAGTDMAIASLILNQAAFAVEDALADLLCQRLEPHRPDIVVGLPTLGLSLARAVALRLGHTRFVALGTSRKFWYDAALSVPLSSITSPDAQKRLYIDPRMVTLLEGRRIALVDDVVSTGTSMAAGVALLQTIGVQPVALGAAMLQTERWAARLGPVAPVEGAFASPLLAREGGGWVVHGVQT